MGLLRDLFGPSKAEVWQQLSREIGADYVDGGFWKGSKVEARVQSWTVTLDTYTVSTGKSSTTYTRMRAPYVNADNFRFKIYRKGLFSDVGKMFGMQDVEVGDAELDHEFIIQGNDDHRLALLFRAPQIRDLVLSQPSISFEVKDDEGWFGTPFPEGVDELYFQVHGVITDVERLKLLYELFAETLHHLCHIGSAYEDDPRLRL